MKHDASFMVRSLDQLHDDRPLILPSLLMCDFGSLEAEIRRLEEAGVEALHLDVMDGHFVPNLSYGLPLIETCRRLTTLPLDVHLMVGNVLEHDYLRRYREAGADLLTVHIEALHDPRPALTEIRRLGALAGLALNPPTPLAAIEPYLGLCDLVLVMSVMPGFGGQKFDRVALDKLRTLRERLGNQEPKPTGAPGTARWKRRPGNGPVDRATPRGCRRTGRTIQVRRNSEVARRLVNLTARASASGGGSGGPSGCPVRQASRPAQAAQQSRVTVGPEEQSSPHGTRASHDASAGSGATAVDGGNASKGRNTPRGSPSFHRLAGETAVNPRVVSRCNSADRAIEEQIGEVA